MGCGASTTVRPEGPGVGSGSGAPIPGVDATEVRGPEKPDPFAEIMSENETSRECLTRVGSMENVAVQVIKGKKQGQRELADPTENLSKLEPGGDGKKPKMETFEITVPIAGFSVRGAVISRTGFSAGSSKCNQD